MCKQCGYCKSLQLLENPLGLLSWINDWLVDWGDSWCTLSLNFPSEIIRYQQLCRATSTCIRGYCCNILMQYPSNFPWYKRWTCTWHCNMCSLTRLKNISNISRNYTNGHGRSFATPALLIKHLFQWKHFAHPGIWLFIPRAPWLFSFPIQCILNTLKDPPSWISQVYFWT